MTPPTPILECFKAADNLAKEKLPYVFGGGHSSFGPSNGGKAGGPWGFDCSGWVSDILHHGGILEHSRPLNTRELENWGAPGPGEFMTLWVINTPKIEHAFLEFRLPEHPNKRWSMAAHTGTICGWFPFMLTLGYTARRRKP